jgi:hypothetical protein
MSRRWVILGLLASVVVILLADFLREVLLYDPLGSLEQERKGQALQVEEMPRGFSAGWSEEILRRNLFSRQRGYEPPPEPPAEAEPAKPPPEPLAPPDLKLRGVVLDRTEALVLLEDPKGVVHTLRVGDVLLGAQVLEIGEKEVLLRWQDEEIVLSMKKVRHLKK